jgi:hypothetical protein
MDPKAAELIEFLKAVPDKYLMPEAARRQAAKRDPNAPRRPKKLRQCKFCDLFFGFREMRLHVAQAHPGGKRTNRPRNTIRSKVGHPCPDCGIIFGARDLKKHRRDDHRES